jgi:hypothetical protein
MKPIPTAIAFLLAAAPALAQPAPPLVQNPQITIEYAEPRHPIFGYILDPDDPRVAKDYTRNVQLYEKLSGVRQRLMANRLLEEFSQFLAPVRLPIRLRLMTEQCNTVNAFYNPANSSVVLCYEYAADAEDHAPKATTAEGITREDAILGGIVGTLLHEGGHAISNLLRLPVLGREEDTADQIAAYVMLQFGREVARTLIKGEAYAWNRRTARRSIYWGVHSTALQRQHMNLCLAYGSDPEGFEDFVVKYGWLPKERADGCAEEYRQVQHAFRATVVPHLDMDLVKAVQSRQWLRLGGQKAP